MPRKLAVLNGVVTPASRLLDPQSRWPDHKEGNVDAVCEHVDATDTVVEVGSGYGVCTVWSARQATDGRVISYEASADMVNVAREAVDATGDVLDDDLADRIAVEHALVGEDVDVWGDMADAAVVPPTELPECDVLVTDCEGAELDIVTDMSIRPRVAIIESHPTMGSPPEDVVAAFEERGYDARVTDDRSDVSLVVATNNE